MDCFTFELAGDQQRNAIIVVPKGGVKSSAVVTELSSFFRSEFKAGKRDWIFDLARIPFPATSLIAFLISATEQVRAVGGSLKVTNAAESARNNFLTFSSLTYLSINDEKESGSSTRKNAAAFDPDETVLGDVDIVEPPIVTRLGRAAIESEGKEQKQPDALSKKTTAEPAVAQDGNTGKPKLGTECSRFYLRTESIASHLYKICDFIVKHSKIAGMEEKQIIKSKIAVYEACLNVIEHSYHSRPDNWIEVWVEYDARVFKIIIQDYGLSFEQSKDKKYNVVDAYDSRQTGGFGLHIIKRSMDEVSYSPDPLNGNQLTLIKFLPHT